MALDLGTLKCWVLFEDLFSFLKSFLVVAIVEPVCHVGDARPEKK